MRTWWLATLFVVVACEKTKPNEPPYVDEWTTRPLEAFSNKLVEDVPLDPRELTFTIQLPHGMFHDPRSESGHAQVYGVGDEYGLQKENTPGVDVRLAPYGAKTLETFVTDYSSGEEVVSKDTLPDGTFTFTARRGKRSWHVEQLHPKHAGQRVLCSAWRSDNQHDLGEPTRLMVERMCGSLVIEDGAAKIQAAETTAARDRDAARAECKNAVAIFDGSIDVSASTYVHPVERGSNFVDEPLPNLDKVITKAARVEFTLDYPFEKPFSGSVTAPVTLRRIVDGVRGGFRHMYEGATVRDIPHMENKDVNGPYGKSFHAITDLVIESIQLCDGTTLDIGIGS